MKIWILVWTAVLLSLPYIDAALAGITLNALD
jgi:hypothetical protein